MVSQPNSASISLKEIASWDGVSQDIYRVVTTAFDAEDYLDCVKGLQAKGIDSKSYIDGLDKIIDSLPGDSDLRRRCIRALRKACGIYGILPASYTITHSLKKSGELPFISGGFGDVWKLTDEQNVTFAVKVLRVCGSDPVEKIRKRYCKEVIVWKRAVHENILAIEGVARDLFHFSMVSRWMENGDLLKYVKANPGVNRLDLLIGVTRGLNYLHKNGVIHGDLKSLNILIDSEGRPRLTDFGLSSITTNLNSVNASTPYPGCTVRYSAPEFLIEFGKGNKREKRFFAKCTKESDIYSLSMVIVELATGQVPFPNLQEYRIILEVLEGKRPRKPHPFEARGITLEVWKVAEKCWRQKASKRPEIEKVLRDLEKIANPDERSPSTFGGALRRIFC